MAPAEASGPEDQEGEGQKGPGDVKGPGDAKGPGDEAAPESTHPKPAKAVPEPASLEEALSRAEGCKSRKPRRTGPYVGQRGCQRCMGSWFEYMRTRIPAKAKGK